MRHPTSCWTEIHRQAGESAIIRLATMARQGAPIPYGAHDGYVWKMRRTDVTAGLPTSPSTTPGYHPDARLLYCPAPGFEVPAIAERPSAEELSAARALICEDLFGDFPFISRAEQAHAVALLLLGFLRPMIDGPTPLHLIEKPAAGTGATLIVDAIATILTGTAASVMTEASDDEEWRKRVTAKLRQIPPIVLIDNLRQKLDSSAVAAALTAPFWEDRILGVSEMARCRSAASGSRPAIIRSSPTRWRGGLFG